MCLSLVEILRGSATKFFYFLYVQNPSFETQRSGHSCHAVLACSVYCWLDPRLTGLNLTHNMLVCLRCFCDILCSQRLWDGRTFAHRVLHDVNKLALREALSHITLQRQWREQARRQIVIWSEWLQVYQWRTLQLPARSIFYTIIPPKVAEINHGVTLFFVPVLVFCLSLLFCLYSTFTFTSVSFTFTNINLLAPKLFFLILAHPVYKMLIIQEPNTLELWNKLHFEEKQKEGISHF